MTQAWFPPGAVLPSHFHDRTVLAITLEGSWDSVIGAKAHASVAGAVLTEPAGERHINHFFGGGARLVAIQPDPLRSEALHPSAGFLRRINHFRDGGIRALASRLACEVGEPDSVSPLTIEALSLEILATATRADERRTGGRQSPGWLTRVVDLLHDRYLDAPTIGEIGLVAGHHPGHVTREFRRHYRVGIGTYIRRLRLEWAAAQLLATDDPIASIAASAGFADQSHFTRFFHRYSGGTPARYRRRGAS